MALMHSPVEFAKEFSQKKRNYLMRLNYARTINGARLRAIRDSSKLAIFYSYKIRKQCKWTNLHSSFNNIRVDSLAERCF